MLATLALHDGQVVSTGRLVDVVWGESAPPTIANTLQSHMSYLRGVLVSQRFGVRGRRFHPADVIDWIRRGAPTRVS